MILSDRDIEAALDARRIVIDPLVDRAVQIQPCSVDLRLGSRFALFRSSATPFVDPELDDPDTLTEIVEVEDGQQFVLHPGEFVLGSTVERVEVPDDLLAKVDGRSSLGRLAILIHATAGFIDPGFRGTITLELSNVGRLPVALRPGMRICQISFETLSSPAQRPYGDARRSSKYQDQSGPTPSRIKRDAR
ncbi:dCTP deaminase [Sandaracinus amylolyticus]|uniref:dCTP deaminase n=1 Tax=Sandaracinus amylolyticus TaxID=927083 RepID=UPI00069D04CE|nr:dCTP deaminase [Sandaracinus amylolyticus]